MRPKYAEGMANSVDPDQNDPDQIAPSASAAVLSGSIPFAEISLSKT